MQEWKIITEHPTYSISNKGQVINNKTNHLLKLNLHTKGYRQVALCKNGYRKVKLVHRLVAQEFIPNPNNYTSINHINEIKSDNDISNLEWCSVQYNNEYSHAKTYHFINPKGIVVEIFNLAKFCRKNQLSHSCMSMLQNGKRKTHKGWTFTRT